MRTLFISDLHLTAEREDITRAFDAFMSQDALGADAVYILGDLFEFWVGDDDNSPFNQQVVSIIRRLVDSGVPCFFVQGNRDFLVGKRFVKKTGAILLGDETVIDLYGRKTLIMHGDTLCTDDVKYQEFRAKVHQPWLQWVYNRIPLVWRRKLVKKVQTGASSEKETKSSQIMDVNPDAVAEAITRNGVELLIHGHTHRPNFHQLNDNKQRIVLGDWYSQSSILQVTEHDIELINRPL
ncbi:UDP-2,3-diacylglucosamine diphosphatase [Vibrio gallicus]|uniref:UDP-2,3-diacylglucosamine diphosphatase n=1 Tax=Vibrio gallicus TaxID=190897 RepID=UPI0021C3113A|nr:UDP-2,3-diacylglucosamine diphosphatase [Vibrio gallicus]